MDVQTEHRDGVAVVVVTGDVDAGSADELRSALNGLLAAGEHRLVVDLSAVPFMDSAGLATLVQIFKRVRIVEGDVRLAALQPAVLRVFELVRLTRVFDVHDSAESAVASYAPTGA